MAMANRVLRSYMAQEVAAGYTGGAHDIDVEDQSIDGSYYVTVPKSKNGSDTVALGDITGTITCDPWYPDNIQTTPLDGLENKIVGFTVSWIDKTPIGRQDVTLSVKSAVIICKHDE